MKRSRWARIGKKFESAVYGISHAIMVYRNFEERERNIQIATGENHKFCEDKYIDY